jgi:hypothetical protein
MTKKYVSKGRECPLQNGISGLYLQIVLALCLESRAWLPVGLFSENEIAFLVLPTFSGKI